MPVEACRLGGDPDGMEVIDLRLAMASRLLC
jgi:hypothetical protein